jgi:pyruvate dehydrogenase E1 component beta subunit
MEECFDWLDAPVKRVAGKDVPLPYAANLERLAVPQVEDIVAGAREVAHR